MGALLILLVDIERYVATYAMTYEGMFIEYSLYS